ncbi:MAG: hypothetical protein WA426_12930, partial [Silvibacterium sp.]
MRDAIWDSLQPAMAHYGSVEYGVTINTMKSSKGYSFLRNIFVVFAVSAFFSGSALHAQDFYLHNGDRLTFYGDSITAQRYYTR